MDQPPADVKYRKGIIEQPATVEAGKNVIYTELEYATPAEARGGAAVDKAMNPALTKELVSATPIDALANFNAAGKAAGKVVGLGGDGITFQYLDQGSGSVIDAVFDYTASTDAVSGVLSINAALLKTKYRINLDVNVTVEIINYTGQERQLTLLATASGGSRTLSFQGFALVNGSAPASVGLSVGASRFFSVELDPRLAGGKPALTGISDQYAGVASLTYNGTARYAANSATAVSTFPIAYTPTAVSSVIVVAVIDADVGVRSDNMAAPAGFTKILTHNDTPGDPTKQTFSLQAWRREITQAEVGNEQTWNFTMPAKADGTANAQQGMHFVVEASNLGVTKTPVTGASGTTVAAASLTHPSLTYSGTAGEKLVLSVIGIGGNLDVTPGGSPSVPFALAGWQTSGSGGLPSMRIMYAITSDANVTSPSYSHATVSDESATALLVFQ